jgi:hypothetical protein
MGSTLEELYPLMEYPSIALGGLVFSPGIMSHCDEVWHYILSNNPKLKVHGFGLTNIELMERYPWYSVDSSSFKGCKRFGRQTILWNGFEFKTLSEDEFLTFLQDGFCYNKEELLKDNKKRIYLEDLFAVNSIKQYAAHLDEINKYKKFTYLTQQQKIF